MILHLWKTFLVLFLLTIFGWLLASVDNRQLFITSQPASNDRGQHGLDKLNSWIRQSGYKTIALKNGYQSLATDFKQQGNGNLIFVSLPSTLPASTLELDKLQDWIRSGNTLVAMLALDDRPNWHNQQNRQTVEEFLNHFDLSLIQLDRPESREAQRDENHGVLFSQIPNRLTDQVNRVESNSEQLSHTWQLKGTDTMKGALILLRDQASLSPVAWLTRYGKGQIFLFTHSDLFSNMQLTRADNLVLVRNILSYSLQDASSVFFDDIHQIITPERRVSGIFLHPLTVMLAGLLVYGLIARLIRRYENRRPKLSHSLQQFIRDTSIQDAHDLSDNEMAIRYANHFLDRALAHYGRPNYRQSAWDVLKANHKNTRLIDRLEKTYQRALASKKINLFKFIDRLDKLGI